MICTEELRRGQKKRKEKNNICIRPSNLKRQKAKKPKSTKSNKISYHPMSFSGAFWPFVLETPG
jgi:hypothetical protein